MIKEKLRSDLDFARVAAMIRGDYNNAKKFLHLIWSLERYAPKIG